MIEGLCQHMRAIHYPADRLEVLFVCESDDPKTMAAIRRITNSRFKLVIVGNSGPRTKPNALNYAMQYSTGDIISVYDAEDRPHPEQLMAAARQFLQYKYLAVVQAPLAYYNSSDNWLTRQFSLEYNALFQVWIPFLARLNLPFPLGGTSNHIRRTALESVGGWDAYNVTEDADLSFRLAARKWQLGYILEPTYEEAVGTYKGWQHQRRRWIKGYMQTWLSHMKRPYLPAGRRGVKRLVMLQITLGMTLIAGFLHVPSIIASAALLGWAAHTGTPLPLMPFYVFCLILSYAIGIVIGVIGAIRAGQRRLILSALTMPIYWLLLFPATIMALRELIRQPFHWNKTQHGVSHAAPIITLDPETASETTYDSVK